MEPIKLPQNWECIRKEGIILYFNTKEELISYLPPMHMKDLETFTKLFKLDNKKLSKIINEIDKENKKHKPVNLINLSNPKPSIPAPQESLNNKFTNNN